MAWRIERDESGIPRRMFWIPEAEYEAFREAEEKRVERNRTMRFVEPSPYTWPGEEKRCPPIPRTKGARDEF